MDIMPTAARNAIAGGKGETLAREKTFNQAWHLLAHSKKTAADICLV